MEEERLWKFRRPEWLNSIWARNAGVYGAGALVSREFRLARPIAIDISYSLASQWTYSPSRH